MFSFLNEVSMVKSSAQIQQELGLIKSVRAESPIQSQMREQEKSVGNDITANVRARENIDLAERAGKTLIPEQVEPQIPESEGIIDALWTGIVEGANDVYDNTVGQIMGDEPKQKGQEDSEKDSKDKNLKLSEKGKKKDKGIIDGLWQGVKEGANDVYDNTVGQIMGDEPKQKGQEDSEKERQDEQEDKKETSTITENLNKQNVQMGVSVKQNEEDKEEEKEDETNHSDLIPINQNIARPNKVGKKTLKTNEDKEESDIQKEIKALALQSYSNDAELRNIQSNMLVIQELRNNNEQDVPHHMEEMQKSMMQNQGR